MNTTKPQKSYKGKIAGLSGLLVLLVALAVFLIVWFFGASYPAFYKNAREEGKIPFLREGISPQGLCPIEADGYDFAMSGYMVDGSPSRICLIGKEQSKFVTVKNDGADVKTHFGGIASCGGFLIVASGKQLLRIDLAEVLHVQNGGSVSVVDSFETGIQNAFCYCANGKLYAGEFYRPGNYETDKSHHLTANGETNYAFVYEYSVDSDGKVLNGTPEKVLSVRAQVQGIAVYEGGITLSTSCGLPDSKLFTYENILNETTDGRIEIDGKEIPLYRLDSSNLTGTLTAPCMSEEIFVKEGRIYILFESLCNKYKYFVRKQIDQIISLPLEDLTA
ncbi:MAG: hypothetical protein K2H43_04730 [Clostridia bacterium]|nr:hypothetical protein [Clostridia bacterium]